MLLLLRRPDTIVSYYGAGGYCTTHIIPYLKNQNE